jgi:DNA polymerase-1
MIKFLNLKLNRAKDDVTLVIDAKYLAYRTKYTPAFKLSYRDTRTGITYGVLNSLRKLGKKFKPVNTVFMWDTTPLNRSKRKIEFAGYKVRDDISKMTEQEIKDKVTFSEAYKILMADFYLLGFAGYELDGYEADDLIALWCQRFSETGTNVIITRDEDMYQCLGSNTEIYNEDDKFFKDYDWFIKTYGVEPCDWSLVKAIGGCKSDTVPGVQGIGEATALQYLKGGAKPKAIEKIHAHMDEIDLYQKLTALPHYTLYDYHIPFKYTNLDLSAFVSFCQQNGFRQFMENLPDFEIFSKGERKW